MIQGSNKRLLTGTNMTTIKLLKEDLQEALNEPDNEIRVGKFWCFSRHYDHIYPFLKKIYCDKELKSIAYEYTFECIKITRINDIFRVEDGDVEYAIFSDKEIAFFIDLYEKSQMAEPNIIDL